MEVREVERIAANDDATAARLRGFGPAGLFAILLVLAGNLLGPFRGIPVLIWASWSGTPWRELGFVRPASWPRTVIVGVVFGVAFKLVMKAIVMPLFGADPINHTYQYATGNAASLPGLVFLMIVGGGFGEETMFRGYMFERLTKLLGTGTVAKVAIVTVTTAMFASLHYADQGATGVEQAVFTGATFGTIFAVTGRIWVVMIAHAAFDLAALAIIYWNLEPAVAHLVF
jgi:hypothetical protein